jgi:hypothetical protein
LTARVRAGEFERRDVDRLGPAARFFVEEVFGAE